jgi:hypothetical protein
MVSFPSFEEFAEVVRNYAGLKRDRHIGPETQFERDLKLTADDGADLLEDLEQHYKIDLTADSFDLKENECLFHSSDPEIYPVVQTLFGSSRTEVRPLTAGQLCRAVLKELSAAQERK